MLKAAGVAHEKDDASELSEDACTLDVKDREEDRELKERGVLLGEK